MGAVPLHDPGLALSVEPWDAVPEIVGGEVLDGGVGGAPVLVVTEMLSATTAKACAAVLLPICTEATPSAGSVAFVTWYTFVPLRATSTVPVAAPVAVTCTWSWAQVLSARLAVVAL